MCSTYSGARWRRSILIAADKSSFCGRASSRLGFPRTYPEFSGAYAAPATQPASRFGRRHSQSENRKTKNRVAPAREPACPPDPLPVPRGGRPPAPHPRPTDRQERPRAGGHRPSSTAHRMPQNRDRATSLIRGSGRRAHAGRHQDRREESRAQHPWLGASSNASRVEKARSFSLLRAIRRGRAASTSRSGTGSGGRPASRTVVSTTCAIPWQVTR